MGLATAAWMEPYWGGAYYHPALLGRLSVLRVGERQRLRPLGQRPRIRARASWYAGGGVAGTHRSGSYYNSRTRNVWQRTTPDANTTRGRAMRRAATTARRTPPPAARAMSRAASNYNVVHADSARPAPACPAPALAAARTSAPARRRRAPRLRARGRRLDVQRQDRQHQHVGRRRASATTTTPTSTATSITTPATAGSSIRRAGGQRVAAIRRGPIASRRRAAAAATSGVAFQQRG